MEFKVGDLFRVTESHWSLDVDGKIGIVRSIYDNSEVSFAYLSPSDKWKKYAVDGPYDKHEEWLAAKTSLIEKL